MMSKITVAYLRNLEKQVHLGEISYSKMVELLNQKVASLEKGDPPYVKIGLQNSDWTEEQANKVRECVTQFKSPSPVSQQLMRDNVFGILRAMIDVKGNDGLCYVSEENCNRISEAICHLSVSPDAQKEIERLKTELEETTKALWKAEQQLTSKESDVRRAVEALEEIANGDGNTWYQLVCIARQALKGNK